MNEEQLFLISQMTKNLPTLRCVIKMSQDEMASLSGVSREKILAIENSRLKMTWGMFLAFFFVFENNARTARLLPPMEMDSAVVRRIINAENISDIYPPKPEPKEKPIKQEPKRLPYF